MQSDGNSFLRRCRPGKAYMDKYNISYQLYKKQICTTLLEEKGTNSKSNAETEQKNCDGFYGHKNRLLNLISIFCDPPSPPGLV